MDKPYIIIHTLTSIDGNINYIEVPEFDESSLHYEEIALHPGKQQLNIQGYLNGKNTTEDNMTFHKNPVLDENAPTVPEGDYVADPDATMYYLSIDARGELAFEQNTSDYGNVSSHIVEVLTEKATNAYKDFLRRKQISYIIAGKKQIDYNIMLDKFYNLFNIKRMMVGGGGTLNWSFIQQGLVDEISMILSPIANGDWNSPRFFMAKEPYSTIKPASFDLKSVQQLEGGTLWIKYTVKQSRWQRKLQTKRIIEQ
ncbi:MAG: RibD family protein [Petrimonas sp.]|nr:RibD family protein [Petrimonas sp.]